MPNPNDKRRMADMNKTWLLGSFIPLIFAAAAVAELKKGDAAPPLAIKHWVKGDVVDLAARPAGSVTVVEFWATWCPPCLMSIPHLSEMSDHFKTKGVTFIGVTSEDKDTVESFLKDGFDSKMRYTVAVDDGGKTHEAWMTAAGQKGIPCAFIVKDNRIAWIGHPMDNLDTRVADLCGDTEYAKQKEQLKALTLKIADASEAEKWPEMLTLMDEYLQIQPTSVGHQMAKYHLLLVRLKKSEEAAKHARSFVESATDADALNALAWAVLVNEDFEGARDLELAELSAKKSVDLSHEGSARSLDTYAAALAAVDRLAEAVTWQTRAVEKCGDGERRLRRELSKKLAGYQKKLEAATSTQAP